MNSNYRLLYLVLLGIFLNVANSSAQRYVIATIAGNGTGAFSGDGGPASIAELYHPAGIALDDSGNIYEVETGSRRVRKISKTGIIITIAGDSLHGFSGDGGPATAAELNNPYGIMADDSGNIYIADQSNFRIRKVNKAGYISTFAGGGSAGWGYGGPATAAEIIAPAGTINDKAGNVYITSDAAVSKVNTNGTITLFAGDYNNGFGGDGGPATNASLSNTIGITMDKAGNIYITDNDRIRKINKSNIINSIAGGGTVNPGDGSPATSVVFGNPTGVAIDDSGNIYIADAGYNTIDKVDTKGIMHIIAGTGVAGYSGDSITARNSELSNPTGIAIDSSGNLFIADNANNRIRKLCATPVTPANVLGDTIVCYGVSYTYKINPIPGAINYTWTLPTSGSGVSTKDSITITAGNYGGTISVTANNACGSSYPRSVNIKSYHKPQATVSSTNISCIGDSMGKASVNVSQGTPPYIYLWNTIPAQTTDTARNLPAGTYTCIINDSNICGADTVAVIIKQPATALLTSITGHTNVSCYAGNNGTALVNASGGNPPYTYSWLPSGGISSDSVTTVSDSFNLATNLSAGKYFCTITDSNGCSHTDSVTLTQPTKIIVTDSSQLSCGNGNSGRASIFASGGTPPYTYLWSKGGQSSSTLDTLSPGTYGFMVTDSNLCTLTDSVVVNGTYPQPNPYICYVTVDSASLYNQILWDKTSLDTLAINNFRIYKKLTSSFFLIGQISIHSPASFIDSGSNPNSASSFYEISSVDTCGQESPVSPYHETMLMTAAVGLGNVVNLAWNTYIGANVDYYRILRDDSGTGAWHKIDSVPSGVNVYVDNNPPLSNNVRYRINTIWLLNCTPSLFPIANHQNASDYVFTSYSNRKKVATVTGIPKLYTNSIVTIYPNPVKDVLSLSFNTQLLNESTTITIMDICGKEVITNNRVIGKDNTTTINVETLAQGMYLVKITSKNETQTFKFIKQ